MTSMTNVTIRNVDKEVLLDFKAEAVREDKTFGVAIAEALLLWLSHKRIAQKKKMISDTKPVDFGSGSGKLSQKTDEILYPR